MFGPDDNEIVLNDSCDPLDARRLSADGRSAETIPDILSDVSFFDDSDDDDAEFQCTLAIIKPEAARLMYKIESIMERNGFIIKTVSADASTPFKRCADDSFARACTYIRR